MDAIQSLHYYLKELCRISVYVVEVATSDGTTRVLEQGTGLVPYTYVLNDKDYGYLTIDSAEPLSDQQLMMVQGLANHLFLQNELEVQASSQRIMMESIQEISKVTHDEEQVIQLILDRALYVLKRAALGVIWMVEDDTHQRFKPIAWAGGLSDRMNELRFQVHEGILGNTIRLNKTIFLKSYAEIMEMSATISTENQNILLDVYDYTEAQSIISVPIRENGLPIGLIMMYQVGHSPRLTDQDVRVLESFADQVSIVLTNTKMVADMMKHNELLLQRDYIHQTFLHLTLEHKGFQAIAQECQKMLNLPVVIYDFLRSKFYSSYQLSEGVQRYFTKVILSVPTIVEIEHTRYSVHPIIEKTIILGLLIVKVDEELKTIQNIVVEQAQTTILLEHIRQQSLNEIMHQNAKVRFDQLLNAKHSHEQKRLAQHMGIQLTKPLYVLVLKVEDAVDDATSSLYLQNTLTNLSQRMSDLFIHVHIYQSTITLIVAPENYAELKSKLTKWMVEFNKEAKWRVQCGIGNVIEEYDQFEQSYEQAKTVLQFLEKSQQWTVMDVQDIGLRRLFVSVDEKELTQFVDEVYGRLIQRATDDVLVETFEAYIQFDGAIKKIAEQLHIHPNTLYQRLEKIETRTQLKFSKPNDRLKMHLAYFLYVSFIRK